MKTTVPLKKLLVALTLLASVSAALAFSLQPEALDLIALAARQVEQMASAASEDGKAAIMPLASLALMGLIVKRRYKDD